MALSKRELANAFAAQGLDPAVAFEELGLKTVAVGPPRQRPARTTPSELKEQQAVCSWWRNYAPTQRVDVRLLMSIPNGSFLYGDGRRRAMQAQLLKSSGMRNGAPDLFLALARREYHGLMVEMKAIGGGVGPEQRDYHDLLMVQGYSVTVAYGAEAGISAIRCYVEGR